MTNQQLFAANEGRYHNFMGNPSTMPPPKPEGKKSKFRVVKEVVFGSGYLNDGYGNKVPFQNFAPKVGDTIELGDLQIRRMGNVQKKGYEFIIGNVNKPNASTKVLIDASLVEKIAETSDTNTTKSTEAKADEAKAPETPEKKSGLTTKNVIIGLVAVGALIGILKLAKVF